MEDEQKKKISKEEKKGKAPLKKGYVPSKPKTKPQIRPEKQSKQKTCS